MQHDSNLKRYEYILRDSHGHRLYAIHTNVRMTSKQITELIEKEPDAKYCAEVKNSIGRNY